MNYCLTASMFCGDRTVYTLPGGLFFNAEALVLKFYTHNCMVFMTSNIEMLPKYLLHFNSHHFYNMFQQ
jgi:hypothetical protein